MSDEEELRRIARREAAARADHMAAALHGAGAPRWDEVYREAHSLAGIAPALDDALARDARRLMTLLADARGQPRAPSPENVAEARRLGAEVCERATHLSGG